MFYGKENRYSGNKNIFIADIHGEASKLEYLINQLENKVDLKEYNIVFLGDILGKGTEHDKTFSLINKLKQKYNIIILKGNWEKESLHWLNMNDNVLIQDIVKKNKYLSFLREFKKDTVKELKEHWTKNNYTDIFTSTIDYFETDKILATHAPLIRNVINAYYDEDSPEDLLGDIIVLDDFTKNFSRQEDEEIHQITKILICGHQPNYPKKDRFSKEGKHREKPSRYKNKIFLDCGGAGTGTDIPIYAYIEDLDIFVA